jgi:hypothetical protein
MPVAGIDQRVIGKNEEFLGDGGDDLLKGSRVARLAWTVGE